MDYIAGAHTFMAEDIRMKLLMYQGGLEARYGDPRVYAAQQEEMAQQDAEIQYTEAKTRERVLADTYNRSRRGVRAKHTAKRTSRDTRPPPAEEAHHTPPRAASRRRAPPASAAPPPQADAH